MQTDEKFIQECIKVSKRSVDEGDLPFSALVVQDNQIISIGTNQGTLSRHAEVEALDKAAKQLNSNDLSSCTLYSICEPCPMCSFMVREYKVGKVAYSLPSLFMGGLSRWNILRDKGLLLFPQFFAISPRISSNILENESRKLFSKTHYWMFGSKARKEQKLRFIVSSILDDPEHREEVEYLLSKMNLSKPQIIQSYVDYDLDVFSYENEIYESIAQRMVLYLHYILKGSWHQDRQNVILSYVQKTQPKSIVDLGFGAPTKYIKDYVLKERIDTTLVDLYSSAFEFSRILFSRLSNDWQEYISFKRIDMNEKLVGNGFDCYIFQDSIEHVKEPTKYLSNTVERAKNNSRFILSLPIGPIVPCHYISWDTDKQAIDWLKSCGLNVDSSRKVFVNSKVDLFAEDLGEEFYNLIVLCSKS